MSLCPYIISDFFFFFCNGAGGLERAAPYSSLADDGINEIMENYNFTKCNKWIWTGKEQMILLHLCANPDSISV